MRKLDFFAQPPQIYIFQQKANKSILGGVIFIFFSILMIFISLIFIFNYILNEKYEIEYSKYYSPITMEQRKLLDSNPEYNPQLNFTFDGIRYTKKNYSDSFSIYECASDEYHDGAYGVNVTQNVSSFCLELLYKCKNIHDDECSLREEDKYISKKNTYFGFDFGYSSFFLDHSKPEPFEKGYMLFSNYIFDFNNPTSYVLYWKMIKYKNEKNLFQFLDSWRGKKNEYIEGFVDYTETSPIPPTYEYRHIEGTYFGFDKFKIIGRIQIINAHDEYDEYKRKNIKFVSTLADICALFTSIKGIITTIISTFYSNSYDNHKMVKNILLKKINKKIENLELFPLQNDKEINSLDNKLIDNKEENKEENEDEEHELENLKLEKISWIRYIFNNIYCSKCGCYIQDKIDTCNEIIRKYMSYDCILYNQIMFEQLLKDYKWNNNSLKNLGYNNNLFDKLKNLELGIT